MAEVDDKVATASENSFSSLRSLPSSASLSSSSPSSNGGSQQTKSLLDRFEWDEIGFETLRRCIEPSKRGPPIAQKALEGDTDDTLRRHRQHVQRLLIENPYRIPNALRYATCCGYFLNQAQSASPEPDRAGADQDDLDTIDLLQNQRLRARRQIILFDRGQALDPHPSDFPQSQLGNVYLSSAAVFLRYIIYTRYQHYVGRTLPLLSFPIRPLLKRIWRRAYQKLLQEAQSYTPRRQAENRVELPDVHPLIVHSIAYRINQLLRLRPLTMERAMESLEKYARFRHQSGCWDGTPNSEVRTYQLENLVRSGDHHRLAELLYGDYRALDSLKRFEKDDVELVHLQAIVKGLTESLFKVKCLRCKEGEDVGQWQPRSAFETQRLKLLRDGSLGFCESLQWKVRVRAEKAEEKFGNSFTALCRNQGESLRGVQKLLRGYLKSLGVEEANVEEGATESNNEEADSASSDATSSSEDMCSSKEGQENVEEETSR